MGYGEHFWQGNMDAFMDEMLAPFGVTLGAVAAQSRAACWWTTPAAARSREYRQVLPALQRPSPRQGAVLQRADRRQGEQRQKRDPPLLPRSTRARRKGIAETPELAKEFPLILSDVHAHRLSQHSYFHNVAYLRELQPYPWLKINPATAEKYGIADGDWVRVESPHGWSRFKAEYFAGISPEVLMTKRGWWQSCAELGLPGYGAGDGGSEVNNLYNCRRGAVRQVLLADGETDAGQDQQMGRGVGHVQKDTHSATIPSDASSATRARSRASSGRRSPPEPCKLRRVYETTTGTFPQVTRDFPFRGLSALPGRPLHRRLHAGSDQQESGGRDRGGGRGQV